MMQVKKLFIVIGLLISLLVALQEMTTPITHAQPPGGQSTPDTSGITQKWLDVPYNTASSAQKLDIYLPNEGTGPFPVIVSIHGGAFKSGDKNSGELTPMLSGIARGYAVVSINYRLTGEAIWPAQINDVKAAIRFIKAHASTYKLNPNKIATWGGSAGGHLAAMAGTSGGVTALAGSNPTNADQSDTVQAVVDWFGPINFITMDEQWITLGVTNGQQHNPATSPESILMGAAITTVPDKVKEANPETYITADDPPFFIQHGTADVLIPYLQSQDFYNKLNVVIGTDKVSLEFLQGAGHGTSEFSATANVSKTLDFLDKYLKADSATATPTPTVVSTATPTSTVTFAVKIYLPIIIK